LSGERAGIALSAVSVRSTAVLCGGLLGGCDSPALICTAVKGVLEYGASVCMTPISYVQCLTAMLRDDVVAATWGSTQLPLLIVATMERVLPRLSKVGAAVALHIKALTAVFGKNVIVAIGRFDEEPLLIRPAV
jgi:hypothetical protein